MAEPPAKEFYAVLLRRLSGLCGSRVIMASHEGKDIGFIFGGMAGTIYRGQQFSYDAQWKKYSLGNVLQQEKIRWLCEEGTTRYDMGPIVGPRMEYKHHWAEMQIASQAWLLIRKE